MHGQFTMSLSDNAECRRKTAMPNQETKCSPSKVEHCSILKFIFKLIQGLGDVHKNITNRPTQGP